MIYRFRSRNDADVVMTQQVAERVLQVIGKDVTKEGIVQPAQLPAAIAALQAAVATDDASRAGRVDDARDDRDEPDEGDAKAPVDTVSFRRRVWPLVEMLKRAQAGDDAVTWHS